MSNPNTGTVSFDPIEEAESDTFVQSSEDLHMQMMTGLVHELMGQVGKKSELISIADIESSVTQLCTEEQGKLKFDVMKKVLPKLLVIGKAKRENDFSTMTVVWEELNKELSQEELDILDLFLGPEMIRVFIQARMKAKATRLLAN